MAHWNVIPLAEGCYWILQLQFRKSVSFHKVFIENKKQHACIFSLIKPYLNILMCHLRFYSLCVFNINEAFRPVCNCFKHESRFSIKETFSKMQILLNQTAYFSLLKLVQGWAAGEPHTYFQVHRNCHQDAFPQGRAPSPQPQSCYHLIGLILG